MDGVAVKPGGAGDGPRPRVMGAKKPRKEPGPLELKSGAKHFKSHT